ncbi:2-dehydro-3-deoxygalactonokinase [Brevundimonas nasdae]|uniref:2-dehydro-3-deoxygalactonokinase n=1 Tax=Brevundimonas nasdae TaxID=172043 RepID=UPI001913E966|nr:2-dehydro-3-deoxygalactonokinase [Brevundimonas nasdae]MBK6026902.1 2-dehydro-3-deoxygalactonokinase [Brevundimonas nasdae]MDQ0453569.1 2-dehydro-3-deoxygalactonokinase [Brevundimonas nasdae]
MAANDLTVLGDWGTTRLRLSLFDAEGRLVDRAEGAGIGDRETTPAETLSRALKPWRGAHGVSRVRLCGMAGSVNGLVEAPYAPCPAGVEDWAHGAVQAPLEDYDIRIAPGVAGLTPDGTPDVMRGEETQIFGALSLSPDLAKGDHLLALPGTHGKWARVVNGRIVAFQTFLTGELFALLKDRSTLLMGAQPTPVEIAADEARAGFADGLTRGAKGDLASALFAVRSHRLRSNWSTARAEAYLSGLIIGAEAAEALTAFGDLPITLIGAETLTTRYVQALQTLGRQAAQMDGDAASLAGLRRLVD